MPPIYQNRRAAAYILAGQLKKYQGQKSTLVMAVPRGGAEIGAVLAQELALPLDIIAIKKISAPRDPEYAIGAIDSDGDILLNKEEALGAEIGMDYIKQEKIGLIKEIKRRLAVYRGGTAYDLAGKTIILADDGIATGFTTEAAINFLKKYNPKKIIVATPVAPPDTIAKLKKQANEVVCPLQPPYLGAIGAFYQDFPQLTDEEVINYLNRRKKIN